MPAGMRTSSTESKLMLKGNCSRDEPMVAKAFVPGRRIFAVPPDTVMLTNPSSPAAKPVVWKRVVMVANPPANERSFWVSS